MLKPRIITLFIIALVGGAISFGNRGLAFEIPPDSITTDVRLEAIQPAEAPILLTVVLTNVSKRPLRFSSNNVQYPRADSFPARVLDLNKKALELTLSNDQGGPGSAGYRDIQPGESINVPALLDPLPPGSYTIEVGKGTSAQVTVTDDPKVSKGRDQDILAKIHNRDAFAQYVASKFASKSLIDLLLQDLLSHHEFMANRAAEVLLRVPDLPADSARSISKSIAKHSSSPNQVGWEKRTVLWTLCLLAARVGTDEALEAVLALARNKDIGDVTIISLAGFKQRQAAEQLRAFLRDQPDEDTQFRAARALAFHKDPAGLEALLRIASNPKSRCRAYAFESLLKYSDDPRVEPAIESGLSDADSFVRGQAEFALRNLRRAKKP